MPFIFPHADKLEITDLCVFFAPLLLFCWIVEQHKAQCMNLSLFSPSTEHFLIVINLQLQKRNTVSKLYISDTWFRSETHTNDTTYTHQIITQCNQSYRSNLQVCLSRSRINMERNMRGLSLLHSYLSSVAHIEAPLSSAILPIISCNLRLPVAWIQDSKFVSYM